MRIKFGNGQLIISKIFPGNGLHLFGTHGLQFLDHAPVKLVRNTNRFHLADFHGLGKHRIELVDLAGNQLRLGPRQFVIGHAVLLDARQFGTEARFQLGPCFSFTRRALQIKHAGATRSRVVTDTRSNGETLLADQVFRKTRRFVPIENR